MTGHDLPATMRASDADRDTVVADLGEHFQAGRLTAAELDERMGRALSARTWGELRELSVDLPAAGAARQVPAAGSASTRRLSSVRVASPLLMALPGLVIVALVLILGHVGWGMIWLLVPALLIARRSVCSRPDGS